MAAWEATEMNLEGVELPPMVKPPGSPNTLFLAGAGVRGLEIEGKFTKISVIAMYLGEAAVLYLAEKWKGKTSVELANSADFFRDIARGPFDKFTRVRMLVPLTGLQYSEKVMEGCMAFLKSIGRYTDAAALAIEKFKLAFKDRSFRPGSSILITLSTTGSATIAFSDDDGPIPEAGVEVIEDMALVEALLEVGIGGHAVSPALKLSVATRLARMFEAAAIGGEMQKEEMKEKIAMV